MNALDGHAATHYGRGAPLQRFTAGTHRNIPRPTTR